MSHFQSRLPKDTRRADIQGKDAEGKDVVVAPELHETYYYEDRDLEILTSDNVLFKVQSYELQAAS